MNQELFGITPPKKLFVKLAIPSLVSMLFSSIYMMTDGMFVGKVIGSKALAAINLVFPIIMIVFAVGDMIAAGASVKIGIKLGENQDIHNLITIGIAGIALDSKVCDSTIDNIINYIEDITDAEIIDIEQEVNLY